MSKYFNAISNEDKLRYCQQLCKLFYDNIGLEQILLRYKDTFFNKQDFWRFIEEYIIPEMGKEKLSKYLYNYYKYEYNNGYLWGKTSFYDFIIDHGLAWRMKNGYNIFFQIAKKTYDKVHMEWGFIPKIYTDYIDNCIVNKLVIDEEGFQYTRKKNISKEAFLDYYLINTYDEETLKRYILSVAIPYLKKKPTGVVGIMHYMFGLHQTSAFTKEHMNKLYCLIAKETFEYTARFSSLKASAELAKEIGIGQNKMQEYYSIRWQKVDQIEREWAQYTHQEIDELLKQVNSVFLKDRDKFSKIRILEKLYGISREMSDRYREKVFDRSKNSEYINEVIRYYNIEQPKQLIKENTKYMVIGSEQWKLYCKNKETVCSIIMNFTQMPLQVRCDVQKYIKKNYSNSYNQIRKLYDLSVVMNKICEKYKIQYLSELTNENMLDFIHYCYKDNYSSNTIRGYIYKVKELYEYLNTTAQYKDNPIINPAYDIKLRNVAINTKHIDYIPPEVRLAIEKHIDELDSTTGLCYRILAETGLRFGDQMGTNTEDIVIEDTQSKEDKQYARFYYFDSKTKDKRIMADKFEKRFVHISFELFTRIKDYINELEPIRDKFNTNKLFINVNQKGGLCNVTSNTIVRKLNALIKKYNITTEDGVLWHYTNKQMRKSVAVDLISNGATLYNVRAALGHTSVNTGEIYYAEVDKLKIMKLNTAFFKQKFKLFAGEDVLKNYTEDERRILYVDFLRQYREVEFGLCCKHQSEGSCKSLGHNLCASCPKLITGEKYLPKWKSLVEDSKMRIEELEGIYRENHISPEEYVKYKEYEKEKQLFVQYNAVVQAIESSDKVV